MLSTLFVTILISLAGGVGLELSDTVEKLFVSVKNDDVRIEVNGSPVPTVAGILTTPTPTPTPSPSPEAKDAPPRSEAPASTSGDCDFEYHKTTTNGEPIDVHYNCTETTEGGGTVSNSVNISVSTN
jgi:hypothetical protein